MAEKFNYSDDQLKSLISGIYSGEITEYNIPEDLYHATANYLKSGLYEGFGGTLSDFSGKDLELLSELRENIYMFSAAKSFTELQQMRDLLINSDGELKSGREFAKDAASTFENFNENWGLTERNTCIAQAQSASKWNEIQKNKDLLPYLVYQTVGEGLGCDICSPLDGLTAPVDDPIWDSVAPVNHFNCECILIQEEKDNVSVTPEEEKSNIVDGVNGNMSDVFKMNAGKDGYIFKDDHPYFQVQPKDEKFAKENFGLPIPTINEELDKHIINSSNDIVMAQSNEVKWIKKLSDENISSIQKYTKGFDKIINDNLRFDKAFERGVKEESIINLSNILESAPKYTGEVYRGIYFPDMNRIDFEDLKQEFKIGNIFTDKGFMSTSYDKKVAASFTNPDLADNTRVLFQIQSKNGVMIDKLSKFEDEKEVLFNRNSKFEVISQTSKEKNNVRNLIITLKEL